MKNRLEITERLMDYRIDLQRYVRMIEADVHIDESAIIEMDKLMARSEELLWVLGIQDILALAQEELE